MSDRAPRIRSPRQVTSPLILSLAEPDDFLSRRAVEYLPGKRAFAAGLTVYHTLVAGTLFQAPRFIPKTFGVLLER